MKRSWISISFVFVLLVLLGVLAFLQYTWLGQIAGGERERLARNVKADAERFAEDFNREIQTAYFNFQMPVESWQSRDWSEFNERLDFYRQKAVYPDLIKNFYFVELGQNAAPLKYRFDQKLFAETEWNDVLTRLQPNITGENPTSISQEIPALLLPVYEFTKTIERIIISTKNTEDFRGEQKKQVKRYGVLVIELDRDVFVNRILPDLAGKYFSGDRTADYKLSIVGENNQTIFQTGAVSAPDQSAKIFSLSPDQFVFFANRQNLPRGEAGSGRNIVINKVQTETNTTVAADGRGENFDLQVFSREQTAGSEKPRLRVFEGQKTDTAGVWTLNVQHAAGSLEQFIANTRNQNLAVSFGILALLGTSIILIFVSAQRARLFAQRQVDFVSSVSHEFRTPLAVIYSAGENLSDGVVRENEKITRYGHLIKREGKKLSTMVEQILAFAGARAGKRKFDFRRVEVAKIIEEAIFECGPLIEENDFTVEKEISPDLPPISGDEQALTQAVQNLIANSIKYANGEKFIRIAAGNGGGKIKITVEDRGRGIEKREIGKIFEPFYRSKNVVDEQIHGSGLGLSLVKQIVDAHGGRIAVESEIGKGSRFTIVLSQNGLRG